MAFFGVTLEVIETVKYHPNADRLDICTLKGMNFQFVTGRDQYKPGDLVLYFPVDALVPQDLLAKIGLEGRLAGKEKNRVKTIRLRGEISQGIVATPDLIKSCEGRTVEDITNYLGVTKYEPEPVFVSGAKLLPLPHGMSVYDIEGADRYAAVLEQMMDLPVMITEKLEGTNFSVMYRRSNDEVFVNSHRRTIVPDEGAEHTTWTCARDQGIIELAKSLADDHEDVIIFGELVGPGIQKNIYKLKKHRVYGFDVKIDGRYLSAMDCIRAINSAGRVFPPVPVLVYDVTLREWLNGKTIQEASNGLSILHDIQREGIVIKPMVEQYSPELHSRLILKQRSPDYLAREKD